MTPYLKELDGIMAKIKQDVNNDPKTMELLLAERAKHQKEIDAYVERQTPKSKL